MKVVILAGGFGTRLAEYTDLIPKPMVQIGGEPIISHIMKIYSKFGYKDFCIALGYKSEVIKRYFLDYQTINSDFTVNLSTNSVEFHNKNVNDWKISLIETGKNSMTGGRLKKLKNFIGNNPFMMTYGDGVANVNIKKLVEFHKKKGKVATMTAVKPRSRYGMLDLQSNLVKNFEEKPVIGQGWINGGFFVFNPDIFNYLKDENSILEKEPLERLSREGQLAAFKHEGFWQCMDSKKDKDYLEKSFEKSQTPPWLI